MKPTLALFVALSVAAVFHSALSASLESHAVKEEKAAEYDGLSQLQKIDQMEFEAAQKAEVAQMNVTEEKREDVQYLEAVQHESEEERVQVVAEKTAPAEGAGHSDAAAQQESTESESSEETHGHQEAVVETLSISLDEADQDSSKQQDVAE